ncbi:LacI family DNA-binding transcriptional regulator [Microbacterium sp. gxy059]|uniref:LacI family DNA-binding transcriptional regulator n=1 Tax=Microbacterium sp. gxy059 TaxID=2957199 RepID=UPI003D9863C3
MAAETEPPTTRVTLARVAERAGVSLKTASRALGGESYVSEATRDRVLAAAHELGYQRNTAASLLASGRLADTIVLVTGDVTNPFYSALARAIEDELRPHGIQLSVANSRESSEQEWRTACDLADRQTRALIVVSALHDHAAYGALRSRGIPVVFVDRPAVGLDADSVLFDNREGGRIAARHLRDAGHSRIAVISDYSWLHTSRERLAGIEDVLSDPPVASGRRELIRGDAHDAQTARASAAELLALPDPPTAIIAGNNRALLGLLEHLRGIPAAERPAVVSFDDIEWGGVLGITVVAGDVEALGRRAAQLAVSPLANGARPAERIELPMKLVARESSAGWTTP